VDGAIAAGAEVARVGARVAVARAVVAGEDGSEEARCAAAMAVARAEAAALEPSEVALPALLPYPVVSASEGSEESLLSCTRIAHICPPYDGSAGASLRIGIRGYSSTRHC
jgi:hypothetical protein